MKARVFIDAFAECLVNVAKARSCPSTRETFRALSVSTIAGRHVDVHAEATGRMFDSLWSEAQNPEAR